MEPGNYAAAEDLKNENHKSNFIIYNCSFYFWNYCWISSWRVVELNIKYEVVNPTIIPGAERISFHAKFTNHPACIIPVVASIHVILPFNNCHDAGHKSKGSIVD